MINSNIEAFDYISAIKKPSEMGMGGASDKTISLTGFGPNIPALSEYGKAFTNVDTSATKTNGVLGDRYFLRTNKKCQPGFKCKGEEGYRHVLINNRPTGNILFTNEKGVGARGLIPGLLHNIDRMNPITLLKSLQPENILDDNNNCECVNVNEKIQAGGGGIVDSTKFVSITKKHIKELNPCYFADNTTNENLATGVNINPITKENGVECSDTFSSMNHESDYEGEYEGEYEREYNNYSNMPDDKVIQLYISTITIIGLYMVIKLISKK
tara:strand:- start:1523 stop:2332 length:810 start_codon:yes stop_codon:yes gene_type:complete